MKSCEVKWREELYYWLDVKTLVVKYNEVKSSEVKWREELYYWLDVKILVVEDNEVKWSEVKSSQVKGRVILLTWC